MEKFKYVFVVLVYKNPNDLVDFFESLKKIKGSYKVVIVNSFFDNITMNETKAFSTKNNCDFLNVDNRGYSYGNNIGIEYCYENFEFEYIIVSNPDVVINRWEELTVSNNPVIYAPIIYTNSGKRQNPYWAKKCNYANKLIFLGYKKRNKLLLILGLSINKIIRVLFNLMCFFYHKDEREIYAPHGSFIIFNRATVTQLKPIFDRNVFLFSEEAILSNIAKSNHIKVLLLSNIHIFHKEDGSVCISEINENNELAKSFIYYFEKYEKKVEWSKNNE